jgi:hypothetical protein
MRKVAEGIATKRTAERLDVRRLTNGAATQANASTAARLDSATSPGD